MKSKIIIGSFLIQILFTMQSTAQSLDQHLWEDRLLLVFSSDSQNLEVKEQLAILDADPSGLKERRMLIYNINSDSVSSSNGFAGEKKIANDFRKKFKVNKSQYTVILIGLDGGEKSRQFDPIKLDQLFGMIDQMPMRKYEVRNNEKN